MALVKPTLKAQIRDAFNAQRSNTDDPEGALTDLADKLTNAIDAYIKSATITVQPGIPVTTAGSATAQTGATTGPGTTTIQ